MLILDILLSLQRGKKNNGFIMIGKNNPLNIRASIHFRWSGQVGDTRGFCDFESELHCRRVGLYLLARSYKRAGVKDHESIIKRWAPPSENNTGEYIRAVTKMIGVSRLWEPRSTFDYARLLAAIEIVEVGVPASLRAAKFNALLHSYLSANNIFHIVKNED